MQDGGDGKAAKKNGGAGSRAQEGLQGGIDLRVSANPLAAAVLLGLFELIFIGASANYLSMRSAGIAVLFIAQGLLMAALSVAALSWGVVKARHGNETSLSGCVMAGVSLGVCAAVAVCALAGIFALAGMGPDQLARELHAGSGFWQSATAYAGVFAGIMTIYAVAGAVAGAIAHLSMIAGRKRLDEAVAYLNSKPKNESAS
jgi:hypothetical protein